MQQLAGYYDLECQRLRHLLKRHIAWLRTQWKIPYDEHYQEATIPDQWADLLLENGLDSEKEACFRRQYPRNDRIENLNAAVLQIRDKMPIGSLVRVFDLTDFDCDLLILALAPELDTSIEILYAYALDDVSRKFATAQLGLGLFTDGFESRFEAQRRLEENAPLLYHRLLHVESASNPGTAYHARPLKVDNRIREFLLGSDALDPKLMRLSKVIPQIPLASSQQASVEEFREKIAARECDLLNLTGPTDCGKLLVAREIYRSIGRRLMHLDPQRLPSDTDEFEELLQIIAREARLVGLAYFMKAPENYLEDKHSAIRFQEFIERLQAPVAIDTLERFTCDRKLKTIAIARPDRESQVDMWRVALGKHATLLQSEIANLVEQFDLGPEGITWVAEEVCNRMDSTATIHASSLWRACRAHCSWRMEDLAQKIIPSHTWDDIVLTPDTMKQLHEITSQVSRRAQVYERWGFARKIKRGRGISALFSGVSGVGKTMAAEVLANYLDLDLYRIDLAGVVSKYIGETEKNLRRIFDVAEQSGSILFFDEADALFGKRTEVKDSHDRYANIEVNYLLQRMEDYRGLAILATNRKTSLDRAFLRRLRFLVDFPFPDAIHRRIIWSKSFPKEAPIDDLDFDFLARLEITGGNIRNVALNAAFLAAERGCKIEADTVMHAVRREYSKIDKLVTESEFGKHYGGKQ